MRQLAGERGERGPTHGLDLDLDLVIDIYTRLAAADAPLGRDQCAEIGALAETVESAGRDEDWYVDSFKLYVPTARWPSALSAVVVETGSGETRLIGSDDDLSVARGVAASCAAPGIITPVSIRASRFMDGGARSPTNADLLAPFDVDRCLVISPVAEDTPLVGAATVRVLGHETRLLEASGISTHVLVAGETETQAFDHDLLNLATVDVAIEVGIRRGRGEGARLRRYVEP
jgi:NTE family protein